MNRTEEIRQAASSYRTNDGEGVRGWEEAAFEAGAAWADTYPKSPWVSGKEKLPDAMHDVLLCHAGSGDVTVGYLTYEFGDPVWGTQDSDYYTDFNEFDYWCPLPEPPKKGGKE